MLARGADRPVVLVGEAGRGKTELRHRDVLQCNCLKSPRQRETRAGVLDDVRQELFPRRDNRPRRREADTPVLYQHTFF